MQTADTIEFCSLLHDDGLLSSAPPSFEGTFGWTGNYHTIQVADTYSANKQPLDPVLPKRSLEQGNLIVHRKSDIMSRDELRERGMGTQAAGADRSCSSDALGFNNLFDAHGEQGFFQVTSSLVRRRSLQGMWAGLADFSPRDEISTSGSALLEPSLFSRQVASRSFNYDAWQDLEQEQLWRRQATGNDIAGNATNSYAGDIGSTQGCPNAARVVYIGVASDCTYTARFANESAVRTTILNNMNTVSNLYRSTFNISLGVVQLNVQTGSCPSTVSNDLRWNQGCTDGYTLDNRLSDFSAWRGTQDANGTGLWHLMTACASGNSEIGVAWLGTLCRTEAIQSDGSAVAGTGVSSATTRDWEVMAHEIGHNFGAIHDCTSGCSLSGSTATQNGGATCCPFSSGQCSANGDYIMNPVSSASAGTFSQCTVGNVCTLLGRGLGSGCIVPPGQRTTLSNQQCGNGILEPGEECDAGPNGSSCCTTECRLTQGSLCDPLASACCTNSCQFASNSTVCRPAVDDRCDTAETCSGASADCPADEHKSDGDSCGSGGLTCASGRCTSRDLQCQQQGTSLGLTRACPTSTSSGCSIACINPNGFGNSCLVLQQNWVDGTECASGRCQNGQCVGGNWQDTFKNWYRSNLQISIPVTIVVALIVFVILGCIFRCCFRRKGKKVAPSSAWTGRNSGRRSTVPGARSSRQMQQPQYAPPSVPPPPPAAVAYPTYQGQGDRRAPPPVPPRANRQSSGEGWINTRDYNGY